MVHPAIGPKAAPGYAFNRGFAVATTDAEHQSTTADFGFHPIARTYNASNAHDKLAVAPKELILQYYSKPTDRSYIIRCSGGRR